MLKNSFLTPILEFSDADLFHGKRSGEVLLIVQTLPDILRMLSFRRATNIYGARSAAGAACEYHGTMDLVQARDATGRLMPR